MLLNILFSLKQICPMYIGGDVWGMPEPQQI